MNAQLSNGENWSAMKGFRILRSVLRALRRLRLRIAPPSSSQPGLMRSLLRNISRMQHEKNGLSFERPLSKLNRVAFR